jgi:dihydrofolate reductase
MRPVVVQVFDYSLDGIIGEEDTDFYKYCRDFPDDPAYEGWLIGSLRRAGLHIVGRVTYQGMARFFPTATDAIADAMNETPKAVFSRTLKTADWTGTTIVSGDLATEIGKLRRTGTGEILAHGGVSFVQALTRLDLADEYRLTVFPHLAGSGQQLFTGLAAARRLTLVSSTTFGNGLLTLTYRRNR